MRKILALSTLALSASSLAQMPSRDQLIGEALKDFGDVSRGLTATGNVRPAYSKLNIQLTRTFTTA